MSSSKRSTAAVVMRVFIVALCVCSALARPQDAAEKKPLAVARAANSGGGTPMTLQQQAALMAAQSPDTSLPNVSEDVLDKALNDRRFVQRQLKCATGEGPCDPIGRKIKAHAPLVLRGMCVKCSPSEVKQIQRVMSHIQKNYPKEYAKMLKQYQNGF